MEHAIHKDNQFHPGRLTPKQNVVVLGGRSYVEIYRDRAKAYVKQLQSLYPNLEFKPAGNVLKSCLIAERQADI